jgi:hypothetical protein
MEAAAEQVAARIDKLYEFDREPVHADHLHSNARFAGLLAGEHVAATEFVIGAFFVLHGVTARDLFLGLLVGNLLAVLSWALLCAPIATRTRLTLYWYLRRIAGPGVTVIYNIANAFLFCILAGAMISVSSTAIGLAFSIPSPQLSDIYPNSLAWVTTTILVGMSFTVLAVLGFEKVSQFAEPCWDVWESRQTFRTFGKSPIGRFGLELRRPDRRPFIFGISRSSRGSPTWRCMWASPIWLSSATQSRGRPGSTRPSVSSLGTS